MGEVELGGGCLCHDIALGVGDEEVCLGVGEVELKLLLRLQRLPEGGGDLCSDGGLGDNRI